MFKQARLKLTAWYLLIITIISLSFSLLIYRLISFEINRFANSQRNYFQRKVINNDQNPPPKFAVNQDLIEESRQHLLINLITINGVIIVVSGALSYFLAGKTLLPIQKMTKDQQRFISDASHELRTPITALKSLFEVTLRDKQLSKVQAKKVINQALNQTNNLQDLSDSLLELNSLEHGNASKNLTNTPLKKIISQSLLQLENKASKKKIKITTHLNSKKLYGDLTKLTELFTIIIDNAIKYSPKNTQIKITSQLKNNRLLVKVADQGIGIKKSDLPYIFDRFYQAKSSRTKSKNQGYGLGLSIAKNIVQAHQGSIKVSSQLKKGSTFILSFPNFS